MDTGDQKPIEIGYESSTTGELQEEQCRHFAESPDYKAARRKHERKRRTKKRRKTRTKPGNTGVELGGSTGNNLNATPLLAC